MEDSESYGYKVDIPAGEHRYHWKSHSKKWGSLQDLDSRSAASASALASYSPSCTPSKIEGNILNINCDDDCYMDSGRKNYQVMNPDMIDECNASSTVESSFMGTFESSGVATTKQGKRCWRKLSW